MLQGEALCCRGRIMDNSLKTKHKRKNERKEGGSSSRVCVCCQWGPPGGRGECLSVRTQLEPAVGSNKSGCCIATAGSPPNICPSSSRLHGGAAGRSVTSKGHSPKEGPLTGAGCVANRAVVRGLRGLRIGGTVVRRLRETVYWSPGIVILPAM